MHKKAFIGCLKGSKCLKTSLLVKLCPYDYTSTHLNNFRLFCNVIHVGLIWSWNSCGRQARVRKGSLTQSLTHLITTVFVEQPLQPGLLNTEFPRFPLYLSNYFFVCFSMCAKLWYMVDIKEEKNIVNSNHKLTWYILVLLTWMHLNKTKLNILNILKEIKVAKLSLCLVSQASCRLL